MKTERFEKLEPQEMQKATGGLDYAQLRAVNSLVDYSWLKNAAAKLRENLQVRPPIGPVPHR